LVKLNSTLVLTEFKSFGTGTYAMWIISFICIIEYYLDRNNCTMIYCAYIRYKIFCNMGEK